MKRFLLIALPAMLLLTACSRQIVQPPIDESEWLRRERGIVVASDFNCSVFIVETARGFSVLRMWGGSAPFTGQVLYGNFSQWGVKTYYNRSGGYLMNADVRDYWLSYWQAMDEMQWSCGGQWLQNKPAGDSTLAPLPAN